MIVSHPVRSLGKTKLDVKNYIRIEDPATGAILSHPAPLESGVINYRAAIAMALAHGFQSPFLFEHYGGDGLSVCAANRAYLRRILPAIRETSR